MSSVEEAVAVIPPAEIATELPLGTIIHQTQNDSDSFVQRSLPAILPTLLQQDFELASRPLE